MKKRKVMLVASKLLIVAMIIIGITSNDQKVFALNGPGISRDVGVQAVGDIITGSIKNIDGTTKKDIPCTFKILTLPNGTNNGTVQIGNGKKRAIDANTAGKIIIPETITLNGEVYKVTELGANSFISCKLITNTGLESNASITKVGNSAYMYCNLLETTGLETNSTVTTIDDYAFARCFGLKDTGLSTNKKITRLSDYLFDGCSALTNTGLEENRTVTTIGQLVFSECVSLKKSGLGKNTAIKEIDSVAFSRCTNLEDIIFEIPVLPKMKKMVFDLSDVNLYYLEDVTTNPEALAGQGTSVTMIPLESISVKNEPKTRYATGDNFDATGLVLNREYKIAGSNDLKKISVAYNDASMADFSFDKTTLAEGDTDVTITYKGKTVVLDIDVVVPPVVGDVISANIEHNGELDFPCSFSILSLPQNGSKGTVAVSKGIGGLSAIDKTTQGSITIPNEIVYEGATYIVTSIDANAFEGCDKITNMGIENNTSIRTIGKEAYKGCTGLHKIIFEKAVLPTMGGDVFKDSNVELYYLEGITTNPEVLNNQGTTVTMIPEIIEIKTKPKTEYKVGDIFDGKGLVITRKHKSDEANYLKDIETIVYNDITKSDFAFDKTILSLTDNKVTITYKGKQVVLPINVKKISKPSIDGSIPPVSGDNGQENDHKVVVTADDASMMMHGVAGVIGLVGIYCMIRIKKSME